MNDPVGRLRVAGILEGASFLLLLFIAMPLKHVWGHPQAVRVVGLTHGILFILFCLALMSAWPAARWPVRRAALIFICALLPFGPFAIDGSLRRDQERLRMEREDGERHRRRRDEGRVRE